MKFLIQHNHVNINQLNKVCSVITNYPHDYVGVIPFTHEITCNEPIVGTSYIPYGSTLFISLAYNLGFTGTHFDPNLMNYNAWLKYRNDMLNEYILTIEDAKVSLSKMDRNKKVFIRPSSDLKNYFQGHITTAYEALKELEIAFDIQPICNGLNMGLVISEPKTINAEWRWFIVDGKIIDGSMYRAHGQFRSIHETNLSVINEAQIIANKWIPNQCVVMDTGLIDNCMKVIEFNCINASGFYDNDIGKIFSSLWKFHSKESLGS